MKDYSYTSPEQAKTMLTSIKHGDHVPWNPADIKIECEAEERRPMPRYLRYAIISIIVAVALGVLGSIAFASDYQCRETLGCTALISEDGQLKTVNFRKGDIVCTEDGWIVSTEDGWKKLKPKRHTPLVRHPQVAGSVSQANVRGPFTLYRGSGPTLAWDGTIVVWPQGTVIASGYYDPMPGGSWVPVGKAGKP